MIYFTNYNVRLVKPHAVGYSTATFKCRRRVFLDLRNNGIKFCGAAGKEKRLHTTRLNPFLQIPVAMGKCKSNEKWQEEDKYRGWLKPSADQHEARSELCKKTFKLGTMGCGALDSHMKSE